MIFWRSSFRNNICLNSWRTTYSKWTIFRPPLWNGCQSTLSTTLRSSRSTPIWPGTSFSLAILFPFCPPLFSLSSTKWRFDFPPILPLWTWKRPFYLICMATITLFIFQVRNFILLSLEGILSRNFFSNFCLHFSFVNLIIILVFYSNFLWKTSVFNNKHHPYQFVSDIKWDDSLHTSVDRKGAEKRQTADRQGKCTRGMRKVSIILQ